jgi:hypothetical protein
MVCIAVALIFSRLWVVALARRVVDKSAAEARLASLPLLAGRGLDEMLDSIQAYKAVVAERKPRTLLSCVALFNLVLLGLLCALFICAILALLTSRL